MKTTEITFGIIIGTRGCFNSELATKGRQDVLDTIKTLGYKTVILPADRTPTGVIEGREDGIKCGTFFKENSDSIDGIIISLPNFGDELGIINAIKYSQLDVPVLVHAFDDDKEKVDTRSRRDAFCGKISVCNNLYQHSVPFTTTTYQSSHLDDPSFSSDVHFFASVCNVVRNLKNVRIGAIGARPGDFQTMRFSEKLLQASGITVVTVDLSEIIALSNSLDEDSKEIKEITKKLKEYGSIPTTIPAENIKKESKLKLALEKWLHENDISAAGIQCWTSLESNYGCAACVSMSMLGESLIPCACETDITGVISMYILSLASGNPSALLDWNNNYGGERNKCVCTHCGNFPKSFVQDQIEISNLDVLGTVLGPENCFGAVKGKVATGDMTYFRISTDDYHGKIKSYLGEGRFTDDPFPMSGGIAVCSIPNLQQLMKHIIKNGFEHHVGMVRGHVAEVVEEAAGNYLGWDIFRHC